MAKKENPKLSSICASDFGLKAGFWTRKKGAEITFRPILGWVSVVNYAESGKQPFCAVVLNDHGSPSMASEANFPDFVGYFEKSVQASAAQESIQEQGVRLAIKGVGRPVE